MRQGISWARLSDWRLLVETFGVYGGSAKFVGRQGTMAVNSWETRGHGAGPCSSRPSSTGCSVVLVNSGYQKENSKLPSTVAARLVPTRAARHGREVGASSSGHAHVAVIDIVSYRWMCRGCGCRVDRAKGNEKDGNHCWPGRSSPNCLSSKQSTPRRPRAGLSVAPHATNVTGPSPC
jgi:hypothetical protein